MGDVVVADEQNRGRKRRRDGSGISANRLETLQSVTARAFSLKQESELSLSELLEWVNSNLMAGEPPFEESEFRQGLEELEARNKMMVIAESDLVVLIS